MVMRRGDNRVSANEKSAAAVTVAAMGPERSKRLHNFNLPTPELTWGNQKFLRCSKTNGARGGGGGGDGGEGSVSGNSDRERRRSYGAAAGGGGGDGDEIDYRRVSVGGKRNRRDFEFDDSNASNLKSSSSIRQREVNVKHNIEAMREKLMFDLKTAADNMKFAILNVGDDDRTFERDEQPVAKRASVTAAAATATEEMPWNLRTRRAAYNASTMMTTTANEKSTAVKIDGKKASVSPERIDNLITKPSRLRDGGNGNGGCDKSERAKLCVPLSRQEIAEDYMAMIGAKPPRRPKKRSKTIQKQLDSFFPGLWLTEVTPDMYKVDEAPESGKR